MTFRSRRVSYTKTPCFGVVRRQRSNYFRDSAQTTSEIHSSGFATSPAPLPGPRFRSRIVGSLDDR